MPVLGAATTADNKVQASASNNVQLAHVQTVEKCPLDEMAVAVAQAPIILEVHDVGKSAMPPVIWKPIIDDPAIEEPASMQPALQEPAVEETIRAPSIEKPIIE